MSGAEIRGLSLLAIVVGGRIGFLGIAPCQNQFRRRRQGIPLLTLGLRKMGRSSPVFQSFQLDFIR